MSIDVSRRAFLGAVASTAALPALAGAAMPAVLASATAGKTLKLGLASYSMRKFTLDQALEMAKAVGIQYMTFKDVHIPRTDPPETTRALRAKIEAAGITIMGGGTITMQNNPVQIRKDFVYAKDAGMPLIMRPPIRPRSTSSNRWSRSTTSSSSSTTTGPRTSGGRRPSGRVRRRQGP